MTLEQIKAAFAALSPDAQWEVLEWFHTRGAQAISPCGSAKELALEQEHREGYLNKPV